MARETKGSGDTRFPVLGSRTSGLHACSRDVSKDSVGQSWRFLLPLKISLFQTANQKKLELIKKPYVPRALRFSCQGPSRPREAIKGPLGCLVSVKKRLKYTLLNSYYKSKCFARPQKACMLFTLAIFTGSSLKTFAPLKK